MDAPRVLERLDRPGVRRAAVAHGGREHAVVEEHSHRAAARRVDEGVGHQLGQAEHGGVRRVTVDAPILHGVPEEPAGSGDGSGIGRHVVERDDGPGRHRLVGEGHLGTSNAALGLTEGGSHLHAECREP